MKERQKINLEQAKKILMLQGYEVQLTYEEVQEERFDVIADAIDEFTRKLEDGDYSKNCYSGLELDDACYETIENFVRKHGDKIKRDFNRWFDDNDLVSDIFWECIGNAITEAMDDLEDEFTFNPLTEEVDYVHVIERKRGLENVFYVLHYDVKTGKYLNEIISVPLKTAIALYDGSVPLNENDRIELIFAPVDGDDEFSDNVVMAWKGADCHD